MENGALSLRQYILILVLAFAGAGRTDARPQPATEPDHPKTITVSSPDGRVQVAVSVRSSLDGRGGRATFSVSRDGKPVTLESPFGLDFRDSGPFGLDVTVQETGRRSVDDTWNRLFGKRKVVRNHFNELTLRLDEAAAPDRPVDVVIRAYEDGAAFRYLLPAAWGDFALSEERMGFRFAGNPSVWAVNYGGFHSSQEAHFNEVPLDQLDAGAVYGLPLLVRLSRSLWAAVTEANLTDWAGMYLTPSGRRGEVVTSLSPRPDEPDVLVHSSAPRASPWRVVMIGERAGDLIESDLIQNLNDPPEGDFSWVKPGIASWDWWNGPYLPDAGFDVGMNTKTMEAFVDLSKEMGWEYVLVDAGWYVSRLRPEAGDSESDITKVIPQLDMQELIRYAHERGIGVWLWTHWSQVDQRMATAFPLYEEWGISGVKIDFMDRDDQEMVQFYHRVAMEAAEHHLMIDFHGAYKPTGVIRTYPNLITREGVLGNEYNKWSRMVTPEHTVTIPFTRGMLGEMDFTPGGFRNASVDDFRPVDRPPMVMGTRAHQLAMFVVYESALAVASDSPYDYHVSPAGLDFLKLVPTTWDDTRVIQGEPGDFITTARRSGDDWYVGSMSDKEARSLEVPLDFLGAGRYRAEIWADAYDAADFPTHLMKEDRMVTASDTLHVAMAPGGGYVAHLSPAR